MHPTRFVLAVAVCLLTAGLLGGCKSTEEGTAQDRDTPSVPTTREFSYSTDLYHVEIRQRDQGGRCLRREVVFTAHSRLYIKPHVDRARAVDELCDAMDIWSFENFAIMRDPSQQDRFQTDFSFRSRVEEDLWDAYVRTVLDDEWKRRRARAE